MQRSSYNVDTPGVLAGARTRRTRSVHYSWTNYLYLVPMFVFILGIVYYAIG